MVEQPQHLGDAAVTSPAFASSTSSVANSLRRSLEVTEPLAGEEKQASGGLEAKKPARRVLFGSIRAALESENLVVEEPGGYVIKRRGGQLQEQQPARGSAVKTKLLPRQRRESEEAVFSKEQPDAAGYTVIRRRASSDVGAASSTPPRPEPKRRANQRHTFSLRRSSRGRGGKKGEDDSRKKDSPASPPPPRRQNQQSAPTVPSARELAPAVLPQQPSLALAPPPDAASGWSATLASTNRPKIAEPPVSELWPASTSTSVDGSGGGSGGWGAMSTEVAIASAHESAASCVSLEEQAGWLGWKSPAQKLL